MSSVLDQTDLVIKRRPKVFEVRAGYDIYDARAAPALASVEQVGRDNLEKLVRPQRDDNARTSLELREPSGPVLLLTHVQAARSSLAVARPDGTEVGLFVERVRHRQEVKPRNTRAARRKRLQLQRSLRQGH